MEEEPTDKPMLAEVPPVPVENVVLLTDFLSKKRGRRECNHSKLVVDEVNRRVECEKCKKEVEPIEALLILADRASEYQVAYDRMRRDHRNLAEWAPHRRAVRELESHWRGDSLPICPHCRKGVTAEGLLSAGFINRKFSEALEAHERETKAKAADAKMKPVVKPDPVVS